MDLLQEAQELIDRWRARAEECRATGAGRADTLDACAAQLAELLARAKGGPSVDPDAIDLFEGEEALRVA